jgi:hypothetical protein
MEHQLLHGVLERQSALCRESTCRLMDAAFDFTEFSRTEPDRYAALTAPI